MTLLVWPGALAIGFSLGLLGSGGSILTVPVLVYLLGQEEKVAIAGALVVVGLIAGFGALGHIRAGRVNWRLVLWFGVPGMAATWLGASAAAQVPGAVQLLVFALVMVVAAMMMLRPAPATGAAPVIKRVVVHPAISSLLVVIQGGAVGVLTGFVGVGGGFLVVPVLVAFGRLDMRAAVATSLVIITMNAAVGFAKYQHVLADNGLSLDWPVLLVVAAVGLLGSLLGNACAAGSNPLLVRRIFAALLFAIGVGVLMGAVPALLGGLSDAGVQP